MQIYWLKRWLSTCLRSTGVSWWTWMIDAFPIGWIKKSYMFYVCMCMCFKVLTQLGGCTNLRQVKVRIRGASRRKYPIYSSGGLKEVKVTYWISYVPRVTLWGFQFGSMGHVFVVPIFGGTVSGYHAQSSTIDIVSPFFFVLLYINLFSTRYETSCWYITVPST